MALTRWVRLHRRLVARGLALVTLAAFVALLVAYTDQRQAAVGGIGAGAFIAAIGLGVVLTYRGSGVVNFAAGAMAAYVAYVYNDLRSTGDLFLPPLPNPLPLIGTMLDGAGIAHVDMPSIPTRVSLGGPLDFWTAFTLSLLLAALLGLLAHALVFRLLRQAPPLAKVVASVGVMLVLQGSPGSSSPSRRCSGSASASHASDWQRGRLPRTRKGPYSSAIRPSFWPDSTG